MARPSGANWMPQTRPAAPDPSNRPSTLEQPSKRSCRHWALNWANTANTIVNNGHTIQLNCAETKYKLVQFHFHRPSEHMIAGKNFTMETHFVHRADSGALAVLGVLMTTGRSNAVFNRIVATMSGLPPSTWLSNCHKSLVRTCA